MLRYSVNDTEREQRQALHKVLLFARRDHFHVQIAIKIDGI